MSAVTLWRELLSFAAVAGLVTIIPGLDTAIVVRSAAVHGPRHGLATALGVNAGVMVWGLAAAVGISALLTASLVAYTLVRISGAVYLIWFGSRLLLRAVRGDVSSAVEGEATTPRGLRRSWRDGLTTNLLNPKIGVFYLAVLPQFISPHASHLLMGLLLAGVHNLEVLLWLGLLILGTGRLRRLIEGPGARRVIDGVTGTTLVGFGIKLGLSRR
jgi:threonine/homoserine/homoserine lactone efflux protein